MPQALDVNLDADEMIVKVDKSGDPTTIAYSKLDRVVLMKESVRKLLQKVEVNRIDVYVKGMDEPVVITSNKIADYDQVENYLKKVAEKYDVAVEH